MVKASKHGQMGQNMKESGSKVSLLDRGYFTIAMEVYIKEASRMIKPMDMASFST